MQTDRHARRPASATGSGGLIQERISGGKVCRVTDRGIRSDVPRSERYLLALTESLGEKSITSCAFFSTRHKAIEQARRALLPHLQSQNEVAQRHGEEKQ